MSKVVKFFACEDCGRTPKEVTIPSDASPELELCLRYAGRRCLWCYDLNLLGGGYEPARLAERWTPEELVELRKAGEALREKRSRPRRRSRPRPAEKVEAQGALV